MMVYTLHGTTVCSMHPCACGMLQSTCRDMYVDMQFFTRSTSMRQPQNEHSDSVYWRGGPRVTLPLRNLSIIIFVMYSRSERLRTDVFV